ncbi:MAG: DNA/RNA non-specific endonuclease [Muribaculaceae bacterium]|nr:DNA/RNA non-specific endonuclease [Muribaculaceae bacterium]
MKHRIWIVLMLVFFVGLVCFGAYNLCSTRHEHDAAPAVTGVDRGARHFDGLDRVKALLSVESTEYEYEGFRLSFNKHNRTPNWVAWELLGSETSGEVSRSNKFWQDPYVDGCPTTNDYRNSGYDRGHMCPAADQKWSEQAMRDCFVMANMCPQAHALNSGAWNTLENRERDWARRDSALVIIAGPIYQEEDKTTIGNGVLVPGAFFKVILAPYLEQPRAIAFVYPNMSAPGNMQNYVTTVDEVEKLTGFDFFYTLPDEIENDVESKSSFREWNKR